jgi:ribosomal protein S8
MVSENQVDKIMNKLHCIPQMLVSLKTNYLQNHKYGFCKDTKINRKILLLLYKEGLIINFKKESKLLKIRFRYYKDKPLVSNLKTIYKPSIKRSFNKFLISKYSKKFDIFFISTDHGIISSNELIKLKSFGLNSGGQLLIGIDLINKTI